MYKPLNFEIDLFSEKSKANISNTSGDAQALSFSSKLVSLFQYKINEIKLGLNLTQLKKVYKSSAESYAEGTDFAKNRGHFALARVNMFVRMCSEKSSFYKKINRSKANTSEILLDITSSFGPTEEDYIKANLDIEKFELNFDFNDVNDLYLEAPEEKGFWFEL